MLDGPLWGRSNTRPSVSGGQVAQLVEQRTENPRVGGSIPPLATTPIRVHSDQIGDVSYRNKLSPVNQEGHPALRPFAESHPEAIDAQSGRLRFIGYMMWSTPQSLS